MVAGGRVRGCGSLYGRPAVCTAGVMGRTWQETDEDLDVWVAQPSDSDAGALAAVDREYRHVEFDPPVRAAHRVLHKVFRSGWPSSALAVSLGCLGGPIEGGIGSRRCLQATSARSPVSARLHHRPIDPTGDCWRPPCRRRGARICEGGRGTCHALCGAARRTRP